MAADATDRRWWVLAGACGGLAVLMLDSTVVNLALPELHRELGASTSELQWIPNAYLLTIAALVVTAGRLGDIIGRRRAFLSGLALFAAGSVIGGAGQSPEMVIAARVVQGLGAALVLPLSLTMVTDAFPGSDRGRAMGIWASVSALALAVGPVTGGVLAGIDWRLIFWINLPIVIPAYLVTRWAAVDVRDETSPARIDVPGVILLTAGLAALTLGLAQAEDWGWASAATLAVSGFGLALLAAFVLVERRVKNPIIDFTLFRNKPYFGASAAAFALVGSYWVVMFFEPQYLQNILDYSPAEAGLLILPVTLPMVLVSPVADRIVSAFGPRTVMGCGMILGTLGLFVMGRIDADTGYPILFAGYLLFGIAMGLVYAPMQTAAMAAMPQSKAGIAAGVLAMNRILSGALSLAVTSSLFHTFLRERIQTLVEQPGLGEHDAAELEGLAAGTASAQAKLAEQPAALSDAISSAVDEAFSFALSNILWFPIGLTAVGTILTWIYVANPPRSGSTAPPDQHRHRGRFHL
ncbi:MAG: MFS transporter [Thermoleophilia bacterium]|nr:MFS transporter [Thermoleophilia bacterium]